MKENSKSDKVKSKILKNKAIITTILFIIFVYILYTIYLLIKDPTDTFTIEEGMVSDEETAVRIYYKK